MDGEQVLGGGGEGFRPPQLARRRLGDGPRTEHHDVAWPHVDLFEHLVRHLVLDAANLGRVLEGIRLDGDGEGLTRMSGVQAHSYRAARTDTVDPARGTLDVGRVNVAAGHDDDVLDAATHHHVTVVQEVARSPVSYQP